MKEKICGIYMIRNTINNKRYIGLSRDINTRFAEHRKKLRNNTHSNKHLLSSYEKYKEDSFEFSILELCNEEFLDEKEIYYISLYNTLNNKHGYNLRGGGKSGRHSLESKLKDSISHQGMTHTEETKLKIGLLKTGIIQSEETKNKRSKSLKKSWEGNEIRRQQVREQAIKNKGRKHSEESKEKMRNAHLGKTLSEEQKIKIGNSRKITSDKQDILIFQLLSEGSLMQKEICDIVGVPKHIVADRNRKRKIENKNDVNFDIKFLLREIINTYFEKGYSINKIPQSIHNLAHRYKYNLFELIEEEDDKLYSTKSIFRS